MEQDINFKLSKDGKELIKYEGACANVVIPEGVEIVVGGAFKNNDCIKKVILPSTINTLGYKAFAECSELEDIEFQVLPKNLSGCAFCNCKKLNKTIIHNSSLIRVPISSTGKYIIPEGIEKISKGAFCDCVNITELVIPQGVKYIEKLAFNGLLNLKSITISASVESIPEKSFIDCGKVEKITIDKSNPKYDSRDNCNAIVESVSNRIIFGCSKTSFVDTITSIGGSAFAHCSELIELRLPNTITEIKSSAFENCLNLKIVELPSSLKSIEDQIFFDCKKIEKVILHEGIENIDFTAFCGCDNLVSINIPNSFVPDDEDLYFPLLHCFNNIIKSVKTPIFNKHCFISLPQSYSGHYVIPEGITSVCYYAFYGCENLTGVTFPNSIKKISTSAFEDCKELSSIKLPNIERIEDNAFLNCCKLSEIDINNDVSISGNPFHGCPCVNIKSINSVLFRPILSEDGNVKLPPSIKTIARGAFENCTLLKSIVIPDGVEIREEAFKDCANLQNVILPEDLSVLHSSVFQDCKSLKFIDLPKNLEIIEYAVFKGCESLESINIPYYVSVIRDEAFKDCPNLNEIDFDGDTLTELGRSSFEGCTSLHSITIPDGITKIEDKTFKNCENLRYINVPNSVKTIKKSAFNGCDKIETADMSAGWNDHREKLGLPPARPSRINYYYEEPMSGLGATEDGPMICTEGRMWPCPYCGSDDVQTYIDGTAQCHNCHRWYKYTQSWF